MKKTAEPRPARRLRDDGRATKQRIETAALRLFRSRGFDQTTMRDVARRAGVSLGLAYHYFASKEAFVLAYYARRQDEHATVMAERLPGAPSLQERVRLALQSKMDLLEHDRSLLIALTRVLLDPTSPLSVFSEQTSEVRRQAVAIFRAAVDHPDVPEPLRDVAATALWTAHLGIMLRFLHDESGDHAPTRALVDAVADLFPAAIALGASPTLAPILGPTVARLRALGLVLD